MSRARFAILIALSLVLGSFGVLLAHATLVRSEPAAGGRLAASPARVWLLFSEPIEGGLTRVSVVSSSGQSTPLVSAGDPRDVHAVAAPVPVLPAGAYRVNWRIVSADGHPVEGTYTFSVGDSGAATVPVLPPPSVPHPEEGASAAEERNTPLLPALLRGLGLGALMTLAGLLFFETSAVPARATSRAPRLVAVLAPLLLAAHALAWARNVIPDHRVTTHALADVLASGSGRVEAWRTGLALLALWALLLARRPRLALAFAALALLVSGASGHSAALHPAWTIPAKAVHLLAGAAWMGGVAWLLVCGRGQAAAFTREARRVSSVAMTAMILVVISGVVQSLTFLPTPFGVIGSDYGTLVLAKVAGLLVLVGFGVHHRSRMVRERGHPSQFGFSLRGELAVMTIVTLVGALLAYVPPPRS